MDVLEYNSNLLCIIIVTITAKAEYNMETTK